MNRSLSKSSSRLAKAIVRNAAITHCPVSSGSRLEILAKSLTAVEQSEPDMLEKMFTMGPQSPGQAHAGPQTGEGAGAIVARQSLEQDGQPRLTFGAKKKKKKEKDDEAVKSLSDGEAIAWVRARLPGADVATAKRIVGITKRLKRANHL